ncbi:MAG: hypothetical protein AB2L12_00365 [Smithellaceae bacterium]
MRQDEQVSRYEINRNVRMVFTRHDVDLTRIDYSFMGNTVYLYGDLIKPAGDFSAQEIENIVREIAALPHVRDIQFDLNNWILVSSGNAWQVTRNKKSASTKQAAHPGGSLGDSTVVIEKAEELKVVLDDLQANSKKED